MATNTNTINQTKVLTALSRMMGSRTLPQGDLTDWKDYCQTAFNYAWRYYKWDWSLRYATVDLSTDPYLPADFDIGGYRQAIGTVDGDIVELTLLDYARRSTGQRVFALQYDTTVDRYKVLTTSGLTSIDFVYQVAPPNLADVDATTNQVINVPFPSAMTIGIGASIYAKQGENPTRADIDQEWDEFHAELDRHVGRVNTNIVRNTNLNLQDYYGTYTGDTRY